MALQVIYTLDADDFKLDDIKMIKTLRKPGDSLLQRLRENYQELRQKTGIQLPLEVGVVTYFDIIKRQVGSMLEEVDDSTTTYVLLDIFEQALALKDEDFENPRNSEYLYTALNRILSHPAIGLNDNLAHNPTVVYASTIPKIEMMKETFRDLQEKLKEKQAPEKASEIVRDCKETLESFPKFSNLEEVYEEVKQRFGKNKVSRDFPLHYLPEHYPAMLYTVSLIDEIEEPEFVEGLMELLELGCKASGHDTLPESVQQEIDSGKKEKFGITRHSNTNRLDDLLKQLPEPKTLITDLYVVDSFPQLAEMDFEVHEFKLGG